MLSACISILGIIITILFIVGFHEFGHFAVARLVGVKVLRFSIGFGKTLFSRSDKTGTEYVVAAIPLGGYVKMLDETEGDVSVDELPRAYNRQPFIKKFLIVVAGPAANMILAFVLYWLLFMIGFTTVAPVIGKVTPHSIAAEAGLKPFEEIISIDRHSAHSWMSVAIHLLFHAGDKDQIEIQTKNVKNQKIQSHLLNLANWRMNDLKPDPIGSLGFVPYEPEVPTVISVIESHSAAAASPLKPGDKILAINHKKVADWYALLDIIEKNPQQQMLFTVKRQNKTENFPVMIGYQKSFFGKATGYLGISPQFELPKFLLRENQYGPIAALSRASENTYDFTWLNFIMIGKLFEGKMSLQSLGGPISIFQGAGSAFQQGVAPFLGFLAFISISIGIINIFPIPGLDGGHVLFQVIEFIIRRPIPEKFQVLCYRLGIILLLLLIFQAVMNDVMRLK